MYVTFLCEDTKKRKRSGTDFCVEHKNVCIVHKLNDIDSFSLL